MEAGIFEGLTSLTRLYVQSPVMNAKVDELWVLNKCDLADVNGGGNNDAVTWIIIN